MNKELFFHDYRKPFQPRSTFNSLDHICNLAIENQEAFYKKIFGLHVNFSDFLLVFKKNDIPPSEYFNVFIDDFLLSEEIVDEACKKYLNLDIDVIDFSWKELIEEERPDRYIFSFSRFFSGSIGSVFNKKPSYVTLKERKILELYLKFFNNKRLSDYCVYSLICNGTVFNDGKCENTSPVILFNSINQKYNIIIVVNRKKYKEFFFKPVNIIKV